MQQKENFTATPALYIVLSQTHSRIGKLIRKATRSRFSHCSISLTADLTQMYSFARYRWHSPWRGGFVQETPNRLTLQGTRETYVEIFCIPVGRAQHRAVAQKIEQMQKDDEEYIYNMLAPLCIPFGGNPAAYKAEICSQFVAQCLSVAKALPGALAEKRAVLPKDFAGVFEAACCYKGQMAHYQPARQATFNDDGFFERMKWREQTSDTCKSLYLLAKRVYKAHRVKTNA